MQLTQSTSNNLLKSKNRDIQVMQCLMNDYPFTLSENIIIVKKYEGEGKVLSIIHNFPMVSYLFQMYTSQ